ncbi:MAG: YeaH/YhbH family protein [Hyphomicrobiaceae bacterium]|nr:YeaH/YhbH family protein [Hyphomicrobiaceae bacterium]
MHIVDRRLNPKAKSLGNRQRFLRRAKAEIREAVRESLKKRKVGDIDGGENVRIRTKSLREPTFGLGRDKGERDAVLPGNKEFTPGDVVRKPEQGGGGSGNKGSDQGEGEDEFVFSLTRDEFLDIFFEDLALPNLVKAKLKSLKSPEPVRAGFTTDGPPAKLNQVRTLRNSLARRIALRRPSMREIEALEAELADAENADPRDDEKITALKARLHHLQHLRKVVGYIDPIDLQYNRHEYRPKPKTQAVMFCLMDVSASMTEDLKELAKRFFMLLHLFLSRHYSEVDIVFIRHTTQAQEVDEETFFRATETGGTIISSALDEMLRIVKDRYPVDDWNIYAAQASDGHNFDDDMDRCMSMLTNDILPLCQYYAYIEVYSDDHMSPFQSVVWSGYEMLEDDNPNFAMRRVSGPGEIYPVFRDLFSAEDAR